MPRTDEEAIDYALQLHKQHYNCAQCVACACADRLGIDEDTAFRMMEGFGVGMGGFTETCGAISGGIAVLGLANSGGTDNPHTKASTYKLSRQLVREFAEKNGSSLCPDLKGLTGGPVLRSCEGCIEDAMRITLAILAEQEETS